MINGPGSDKDPPPPVFFSSYSFSYSSMRGRISVGKTSLKKKNTVKKKKRAQKRPCHITLDQLEEVLKDEKKFYTHMMEYGILKKPVCTCGNKEIKIVTYRERLWFRCCSRRCKRRTACRTSSFLQRQKISLKQWIKVFVSHRDRERCPPPLG